MSRARRLPRFALAAALLVRFLWSRDGFSAPQGAGPALRAELRDHPKERAEWNAMFRRDHEGRLVPENRLRALREACDLPVDPSMVKDPAGVHSRSDAGPSAPSLLTFGGTAWQSLGPRPINPLPTDLYRWTSASGRITALAVHPTNPSVMLLGSATGGIWKSTDGGGAWRPVSDTAPSLASSSIAFAPSNPSIVFAATGEVDSADSEFAPSRSLGIYLSAGLLRSVDGGESWTRVDTNLPAGSVLSRVVVHPTNPQLVLVGVYLVQDVPGNTVTPGGIYRSTNGGVTFSKTFEHYASDLVQDPTRPDAVLAAFGVSGGCPSCQEDGIWGSTDFGLNWSKVLTAGTTTLGNVKLTASRTNPAVYYASILNAGSEHAGLGGIYRSTDGGGTWSKMSVHPDMCPAAGSKVGNQCNYDHFIAVNPSSPGIVYFGSINVYRSGDGAVSWSALTPFYDGTVAATIHPDQHAGLFLPSGPETFFVGSDGGLFRTTNSGSAWTSLNATLSLTQFNSISLHPSSPSTAIGGTQDNGSPFYSGVAMWDDRTAGDGGNPLIRQDNPSVLFGPHYYAGFEASTDGGATFHDASPCGTLQNCTTGDPTEQMAFYVPTDAPPGAPGTLFVGTNRIWANTSFGTDPSAWRPRSSAAITTTYFTAIEVVGDGTGVVWGGSEYGSVYYSTNGGATFVDRTSGLGPGVISKIRAVSADGRSAYVTQGGYSGQPSQHVFRTADGGQSWTNVTGNLPDAPVLSIEVDPTDPSDLFVGTDVGVFRSVNGGASWASFNQGLPNVPVNDLRFGPTTGILTAATYGRGVFRITTAASNRPPVASITSPSGNVTVNAGQSVSFAASASDPDGDPLTYAWSFGDGGTSSLLSPGPHTYGSAGVMPVTFVATDSHGASSPVQTRTVTVQGGGGGGGGATAVKLLPIVLDVAGSGGSRFGSELALANRGTSTATVRLDYVAATALAASGSGSMTTSVGPGRQVVIPDAIAFLRAGGLPIPGGGSNQGGTLRATFSGLSSSDAAFVGARTTTPSGTGRAGLSYPGVSPDELFTDAAWIYGLRQNGADRSNLALVNGGTGGPVTLRVKIWRADGTAVITLTPDVTLGPGQWAQIARVLEPAGLSAGYAEVDLVAGTDPFYAYGVFNDNVTNDGSFVAPQPNTYNFETQSVPVLVETPTFSSELVLTNYTNQTQTVLLSYAESLTPGGGAGGTATEPLAPFQQKIIPDAIQYLRSRGVAVGAKGSASFAGALNATFRIGSALDGGFAGARTGAPAPTGGQYGLFYSALGISGAVTDQAWLFGLQENSSVRSNIAMVNVGDSGASITLKVEIYNGATGQLAGTTENYTLGPGAWSQKSGLLPRFGAQNGYARVVKVSGSGRFLAYGVVNDGATPSSGATNDGSYVAFSNQ